MSTSPSGRLSSQLQGSAVAVRRLNTPASKWLVSSNASRLDTLLKPSSQTPEAVSHVKRLPKLPPWRPKPSPGRSPPEPAGVRHRSRRQEYDEYPDQRLYCGGWASRAFTTT